MKKNIPKDEAIRKGIIGYGVKGGGYIAFISVIDGKYYTGYEVREEMKLNSGEILKPGQFDDIRKAKNPEEALRHMADD